MNASVDFDEISTLIIQPIPKSLTSEQYTGAKLQHTILGESFYIQPYYESLTKIYLYILQPYLYLCSAIEVNITYSHYTCSAYNAYPLYFSQSINNSKTPNSLV